MFNRTREFEIQMYLDSHPEIENFLIFDDDLDMGELRDHLIKTDTTVGFTMVNYESAAKRHQKLAVYDEVFGKQ